MCSPSRRALNFPKSRHPPNSSVESKALTSKRLDVPMTLDFGMINTATCLNLWHCRTACLCLGFRLRPQIKGPKGATNACMQKGCVRNRQILSAFSLAPSLPLALPNSSLRRTPLIIQLQSGTLCCLCPPSDPPCVYGGRRCFILADTEAVIFFSVLLVVVLMSDGRSHWLKGYLLMLAYTFIAAPLPARS